MPDQNRPITAGFNLSSRSQTVLILVLLLAAFAVRVYHINHFPRNAYEVSFFQSALYARAEFFKTSKDIPLWRKEIAKVNQERLEITEPTVVEFLASWAYRALGAEHLSIPRLLSSSFWILGGLFLYLLALKFLTADEALFATAYYLFLPWTLSISMSFQPDLLMIMVFLISLYALYHYFERPCLSRMAVATASVSFAAFVKLFCLFPILGAFGSAVLWKKQTQQRTPNSQELALFSIGLLPALLYYGIAVLRRPRLIQVCIMPQLLIQPIFWKGWFSLIQNAAGFPILLCCLFGMMTLKKGLAKAFLEGLWMGYFLFVFTFTYYSFSHDYSHLQLVPIAALSMSIFLNYVIGQSKRYFSSSFVPLISFGLLCSFVIYSVYQARWLLVNPGFDKRIPIFQEIGDRVHHSTKTIFLSHHYGLALQYFGELSGIFWPRQPDIQFEERWMRRKLPQAKERLEKLRLKHAPEYFIVTDLKEFQRQADLSDLLTKGFHLVAESENYLIFDLSKPKISS